MHCICSGEEGWSLGLRARAKTVLASLEPTACIASDTSGYEPGVYRFGSDLSCGLTVEWIGGAAVRPRDESEARVLHNGVRPILQVSALADRHAPSSF